MENSVRLSFLRVAMSHGFISRNDIRSASLLDTGFTKFIESFQESNCRISPIMMFNQVKDRQRLADEALEPFPYTFRLTEETGLEQWCELIYNLNLSFIESIEKPSPWTFLLFEDIRPYIIHRKQKKPQRLRIPMLSDCAILGFSNQNDAIRAKMFL
jgi:hypothetical protein